MRYVPPVMLGGRWAYVVSLLPTNSSFRKNPLSPFIPPHRHASVATTLFSVCSTWDRGGGTRLWLTAHPMRMRVPKRPPGARDLSLHPVLQHFGVRQPGCRFFKLRSLQNRKSGSRAPALHRNRGQAGGAAQSRPDEPQALRQTQGKLKPMLLGQSRSPKATVSDLEAGASSELAASQSLRVVG
jgi:hypothetical protein